MSEQRVARKLPAHNLQHYDGWLSPDGELIGCATWGHEMAACEIAGILGYEPYGDHIRKHGWIKLFYKLGKTTWELADNNELSQRQRDTIYEWSVFHNEDINVIDSMGERRNFHV